MKMDLTPARKAELQEVQYIVNRDTTYISDEKHYHVEEYWEAVGTDHKGDCEDYALAKMKLLRDKGWPKESLDIGICKVKGVGHAVLLAHTSEGDYVLDNNLKSIALWNTLRDHEWIMVSTGGSFTEESWHSVL